MAGLQSAEGRMMIDSVVWAPYINVTDTQTDIHVAIANAANTVRRAAKIYSKPGTPLTHRQPNAHTLKCFFRPER